MLFLSTEKDSNSYNYQFMVMSVKGTQYVYMILTLKLDTYAWNQPPVETVMDTAQKSDISSRDELQMCNTE